MKKREKKQDTIVYGVKYRFYPSDEQISYIDGMFGASRFFYNKVLEKFLSLYEKNQEIKKYNETSEEKKDLIPYNLLRGSNPNTEIYNIHSIIEEGKNCLDENNEPSPKDYSWLKEYHSTIYQNVVTSLGKAWDDYFNYLKNKKNEVGVRKVGKPKKKKKGDVNSVTLTNTSSLLDGKNVIDWSKGLIKTPSFRKIGWCKCVLHKRFKGLVKQTTISKDNDGKYYISLTVEEEGSYPEAKGTVSDAATIGIDFGLKTFATITNASDEGSGRKVNPNIIDNVCALEEKIRKLQKAQTRCSVTLHRKTSEPITMTIKEMNRKIQVNRHALNGYHKEYSKGYHKYAKEINKLQTKIYNIKHNYIGNFASALVNDDNVNAVCVETLNIRDMMIRDKTNENEGKKMPKNRKFRKAMARKFSKFAIGETIEQIAYDCQKSGKHFVKAPNRFASTKLCSSCGYKLPTIDLSVRKWTCPNCGKEHDRDMNAAKNLAKYALAKLQA